MVDFSNIVLENENFPILHKLKLLFCVIVAITFVSALLFVLLAHHVNFNTLFAQGKLERVQIKKRLYDPPFRLYPIFIWCIHPNRSLLRILTNNILISFHTVIFELKYTKLFKCNDLFYLFFFFFFLIIMKCR